MNIFRMIFNEIDVPQKTILWLAIISGAANALMLAVINLAAEAAADPKIDTQIVHFLIFLVLFIIFYIGKKRGLLISNEIVEVVVHKIRTRISNKIKLTNLQNIEKLGESEVHTRLSQESSIISQSSSIIINSAQQVVMLIFTTFYIAYISISAFLMAVAAIAVGIGIYYINSQHTNNEIRLATLKETKFFNALAGILHGFKETKMNWTKGENVVSELQGYSNETKILKINAGRLFANDIMFSQIFWYTLIAVIVFVLPQFTDSQSDVIIKLTTAILFMVGPLENTVGSIPVFAKANIATEYLYDLEQKLDAAKDVSNGDSPTRTWDKERAFEKIEFEKIQFNYRDDENNPLFGVGPLSLEIDRNETIFITGGNGSGKSTIVKLLLGLYFPESGQIKLDGKLIGTKEYIDYRQLFSIVLSDFHLFEKLYGLKDVDEERLNKLLVDMDLQDKLSYTDGLFTNLNLSTGQKKRLALIVMLLEERPILVLDEWAADQDPIFRKKFYEELIPEFKARGITTIAVTHDDHYFHLADRILKMEYGEIEDITNDVKK